MTAEPESSLQERWFHVPSPHSGSNWADMIRGHLEMRGAPQHPTGPFSIWEEGEVSFPSGLVMLQFSELNPTIERFVAANIESRLREIRRRSDLVYEMIGLQGVTPELVDQLAEDAYNMMESKGTLDSVEFATQNGIDIRLSELVFRRLKAQGSITEA